MHSTGSLDLVRFLTHLKAFVCLNGRIQRSEANSALLYFEYFVPVRRTFSSALVDALKPSHFLLNIRFLLNAILLRWCKLLQGYPSLKKKKTKESCLDFGTPTTHVHRWSDFAIAEFQDFTCRILKFQDLACRVLKFQDFT